MVAQEIVRTGQSCFVVWPIIGPLPGVAFDQVLDGFIPLLYFSPLLELKLPNENFRMVFLNEIIFDIHEKL